MVLAIIMSLIVLIGGLNFVATELNCLVGPPSSHYYADEEVLHPD
jgi:hypothetical protein